MRDSAITTGLAALALILSTTASAAESTKENSSAALKLLVSETAIRYEKFQLRNGLRVIVHTDRKAPIVAVSLWYDVGSKHEPTGKTGFAHLFEHLMFNGSENADRDWHESMSELGATSLNGTTAFDRTNYFETVPVNALNRLLYLESDRMGYLLGAVTSEKLRSQIGVVQNEKLQRDNQPFGLVSYAQREVLFPAGHPYGHATSGSVSDLNVASLNDVKQWFREHYSPNNAVLVLSGDIDAKRARSLVQRYFGSIKPGPKTRGVVAPIPALTKRVQIALHDQISTTRIYRTWITPGVNDRDNVPLSLGAAILAGLSSSRLDNALVREEQLALQVYADIQSYAEMSQFEVVVDVKPGIDPAIVEKRIDALINDLTARGPSKEELHRAVTAQILNHVNKLETANGKATMLAEGELISAAPNHFADQMKQAVSTTPGQVQMALARWLNRPFVAVKVLPGERVAVAEVPASVTGGSGPTAVHRARVTRDPMPGLGAFPAPSFPDVDRIRLSNGIEVIYARRDTTPLTRISIQFDAGYSADQKSKLGLAYMAAALLTQGTETLSSRQIAERMEELGAPITVTSNQDRTIASLIALSSNLVPALDLFSDIVQRPAFEGQELERARTQQLSRIAAELSEPRTIADRTISEAVHGKESRYANPATGTQETVAGLGRSDLLAFKSSWLRPDKAKIFIVSNVPLSQLRTLLEARFGAWKSSGSPGTKSFPRPARPRPRIILVDRKGASQSQIMGGELLPIEPKADLLPLEAANEVVGNGFLSRINIDIRETRGWSYGVNARLNRLEHGTTYEISAPVQTDKTANTISALGSIYGSFLTNNGVTSAELKRVVINSARKAPGSFETSNSVLNALVMNDLLARPDDYQVKLPGRYGQLTTREIDTAARRNIDPQRFIWVVVGDAAKVRPQLAQLGMLVEER